MPGYQMSFRVVEEGDLNRVITTRIKKYYFKLNLLDLKGLTKAAKLLSMNLFGKGTGPDRLTIRRKDGTYRTVEITTQLLKVNGNKVVLGMVQDITERIRMEKEQQKLIDNLETVLERLVDISGMLPICSHCKKIRDAKGQWHQIESYMTHNFKIMFSHGICPECKDKHYPESNEYDEM